MKTNHITFDKITKIFPGSKALNQVSFSIKQGEVHALLGENGAGKTTLTNILHGIIKQTDGAVLINGQEVNFSYAGDAIAYGIAKVHQEINLVPEMTVAQNLLLGNEPQKSLFIDLKRMRSETNKLLNKLNCSFSADDKINTLSAGEMQMLQIAKALNMDAKIITFDEPTASLSTSETETLFKIINQLKQNGITIIYISHRLDEIFQIADRATVLRDGMYIGTYDIKKLSKESLIRSMVGRDVTAFATREEPCMAQWGDVVLEVKNLTRNGFFNDISFSLNRGEILGFFGLVGSKRTDVMRSIFGADKISGGEIYLEKQKVEIKSPNEAVRNGIGLISEERKAHGFVKDLTNSENIALPSLKQYVEAGFLNHRKRVRQTSEIGDSVNLRPRDPEFMTNNLSGGNQQKVVLAKWLSTNVDVFIFDEPTKGIDVGAKAEIYRLMETLVKEGKSIIMVSSELPEIIGISDRVIVMREGEMVAEINKTEFSEENILLYAMGGK